MFFSYHYFSNFKLMKYAAISFMKFGSFKIDCLFVYIKYIRVILQFSSVYDFNKIIRILLKNNIRLKTYLPFVSISLN
jgi:hypothetical protein